MIYYLIVQIKTFNAFVAKTIFEHYLPTTLTALVVVAGKNNFRLFSILESDWISRIQILFSQIQPFFTALLEEFHATSSLRRVKCNPLLKGLHTIPYSVGNFVHTSPKPTFHRCFHGAYMPSPFQRDLHTAPWGLPTATIQTPLQRSLHAFP